MPCFLCLRAVNMLLANMKAGFKFRFNERANKHFYQSPNLLNIVNKYYSYM